MLHKFVYSFVFADAVVVVVAFAVDIIVVVAFMLCPFAVTLLWSGAVFWSIIQTVASAAGKAVAVYITPTGRQRWLGNRRRGKGTAFKWLTECGSSCATVDVLGKLA